MSNQNIPAPVDATLTKAGEAADAKVTGDAINDLRHTMGENSVAEQISAAIHFHKHNEYVKLDEFNALKALVEQLCDFVGDTSVAEQISCAHSALKETFLNLK